MNVNRSSASFRFCCPVKKRCCYNFQIAFGIFLFYLYPFMKGKEVAKQNIQHHSDMTEMTVNMCVWSEHEMKRQEKIIHKKTAPCSSWVCESKRHAHTEELGLLAFDSSNCRNFFLCAWSARAQNMRLVECTATHLLETHWLRMWQRTRSMGQRNDNHTIVDFFRCVFFYSKIAVSFCLVLLLLLQ